jgi:hypothetical protein
MIATTKSVLVPGSFRIEIRNEPRESPMRIARLIMFAVLSLSSPAATLAQHDPAMHGQHGAQVVSLDGREEVAFPPEMRGHTLTNMRDHLLALQEIQYALSKEEYERAGDIAEQRLGMTALIAHGSYERSGFMPKGMQDIGSAMHRNASRFAVAARDVGATGDVKPALAALGATMGQCVACHAAYRVK